MTEAQENELSDMIMDVAISYANGHATDFRIAAKAAIAFMNTPSTSPSTWRENGDPDPHGKHYDCERAALTLGSLTDDELANGAFMNYDTRLSIQEMLHPKPGQHMPIVWMTAVKDRIRWLSRALVKAQATSQTKTEPK